MLVFVKRLTLSSLFSLIVLAGCGTRLAVASGASAQVAVSVSGASLVTPGTTVQYAASIAGSPSTAVTWKIVGTSASENYGTISASGVYTPPPAVPVHGQIQIVATSQANPAQSSSTAITITNPVPAIASASFTAGYHSTFLVDVKGANFMPTSVVMYLGYGWPTTYVSSTELTFTMTSPPAAGTVVPLSVVTPAPGRTQSANYSATVPATVAVSVTGGATQAIVSTPTQYTASVTGTANTAVTWSIVGTSTAENYGTISSTGLYTPPAAVPVHGTISITATSQTDTTKSAKMSVTIANPTPSIASAALALQPNGSYLVDVKGSNFMPASAAMPGAYGVPTTYVSANELKFTLTSPPAAGTSIALSVVTPAPGRTQSASYNMVIPSAIGVSVSGANVATVGTPVQYTASVSGAPSTAVTWKITGTSTAENYGTISASGLYTPPAAVPVHGTISIIATSTADTTKSASESVTISNPVPAITAANMTPETGSKFLVDVLGSNFQPASAVLYAGYGVTTTYVSASHLQFTLASPPAAGTAVTLGVVNPAPGRTQSANFSATIPGLVAVSVSGAAQATVSTPVQYTATVTGTSNTAVTWKITGTSTSENYGTISAAGLYTPPATVPAHPAITIAATSTVDTTKSSSIAVSLMNAVPVIATATTTMPSNGSVLIDVKGSNFIPSSYVQYSGYGLATTYVSATEMTATIPQTTAAGLTQGSAVIINAVTPNPGKTISANYSAMIPGKVGVVIAGSGMVGPGETSQYVATVTGTSNTAVTWSVSKADGTDPGTISSTGLYAPPASIAANTAVTVTATSQAQPSSIGSATVSLVTVTAAAAARLLDQSSFGPTDATIAHVQTIGLSAYIDEQMAMPATLLPVNAAQPFCGNAITICNNENWWNNAVTAPDQLRQRVSNALGEMLVIAYRDIDSATLPPYENMLTTNAFGNWQTIMKQMTLSPAMGEMLNMMNSGKPAPGMIANENFARENMQLFNMGLNLLNQDGTLQTDGNGNPIPAYTETQVEAFSRVFTGWTTAPAAGGTPVFPNYIMASQTPMISFDSAHDMSQKVLLNSTLPAGQTAEQDLDGAVQDVFNHPNVGPFVTTQLIQHLVKSNPSPAYVGRISAVFANDGTGVRGNMGAVIKAILLDPEARAGDTAPVANDGYLREPMIWTAGVLRSLNAVPKPGVVDNSAYTAIDSFAAGQQELLFDPATVFNFYPAQSALVGTNMQAPQFALETSATIMGKLTLASAVVDNEVGELAIDLSDTSPLATLDAASDGLMLDELNKLFLHGTMSAQMRSTIETAISGVTDPAQRVRMAVYLVITSSQYKVIH